VQPHFSPEARRIVFTRGKDPDQPEGIWVCDTDGGNLRRLVAATGERERVASPVWVSESRIYYAHHPGSDPSAPMEIWRVDLSDPKPQRVFRFGDTLSERVGLVTDVSPDLKQLAVIAQQGPLWPDANVYITDLEGNAVKTIWSERPDDRREARALWSPKGDRIAWQHTFTPGNPPSGPTYYGVGQAWRTADGEWTARLQADEKATVVPLAWSPDGEVLLCAEIHEGLRRLPGASLFLMDHRFERIRETFRLPACPWVPKQRDYGRLADWATIPHDAPLPPKLPPLPAKPPRP
jgi:Tol biopolymer transport system component